MAYPGFLGLAAKWSLDLKSGNKPPRSTNSPSVSLTAISVSASAGGSVLLGSRQHQAWASPTGCGALPNIIRLYIQNLKFLQDFWVHPFHVEAEQETQVLESLQAYPGVSVRSLLDAHPGLPVDVIWALLT